MNQTVNVTYEPEVVVDTADLSREDWLAYRSRYPIRNLKHCLDIPYRLENGRENLARMMQSVKCIMQKVDWRDLFITV